MITALLTPLIAAVSVCPALLAQSVITVETKGVGYSEKAALKDAARNAVSQVLDTIVEAETIVLDDEVVEDKIIAVSGGFIENFKVIEPAKKNPEGIFTVKIRADVRFDKLSEKVTQYASSEVSINMGDIKEKLSQEKKAAENAQFLKEEKQKEMAAFLFNVIDDYMKLWKFKVIKCVPGEKENSVDVEIQCYLSIDDYVGKFYIPLQHKFNELGIQPIRGHANVNISRPEGRYSRGYPIDVFNRENDPRGLNFFKFLKQKGENEQYILRIELKNSKNEIMSKTDINLKNRDYWARLFDLAVFGDIRISPFNEHYRGAKNLKGKLILSKPFNIKVYKPHEIDDIKRISVRLLKVDAKSPTDFNWFSSNKVSYQNSPQ